MTARSICLWAALLGCYTAGAPLFGQVVRLPAVMPPSEPYPAAATRPAPWESGGKYGSADPASAAGYTTAMASRAGSPAELPPIELPLPAFSQPAPPDPDRPPDARDGFFQKLLFSYEWITGGDGDEMGVSDLEIKTILALPIPSRKWPLLITPGFAVHYLDGPTVPDMPARVYDAYAQFRSLGRINPRLGAELAVTLGAFSDFEQGADEAFRVTGHGAVMWDWTPTTKIVLGAAYIDTYDTDVIPIGGLIWKPHPDLSVEAVFPSPKIARRFYWRRACTEQVQDWIYVAGEFGNDTWAVRRGAGLNDEMNYRDWRLLLGLERKAIGGLDRRIEIGYVFSRRLHFDRAPGEVPLSDALLLRAGLTY